MRCTGMKYTIELLVIPFLSKEVLSYINRQIITCSPKHVYIVERTLS